MYKLLGMLCMPPSWCMPTGSSVQFGQTSAISNNGVFVAVGTAASNNVYFNLAYMYKKDAVTGRFRCEQHCSRCPWKHKPYYIFTQQCVRPGRGALPNMEKQCHNGIPSRFRNLDEHCLKVA